MPYLFTPLLNIARQDLRWKRLWGGFHSWRQGAGGGLQDLGQRYEQRSRPGQRLPGGGEGLRVRKRMGCLAILFLLYSGGLFRVTLGQSTTPCLRPLAPAAAYHPTAGFTMEITAG